MAYTTPYNRVMGRAGARRDVSHAPSPQLVRSMTSETEGQKGKLTLAERMEAMISLAMVSWAIVKRVCDGRRNGGTEVVRECVSGRRWMGRSL